MVIAYWIVTAVTFILVMNAFLKDHSISNTDPMAWIFMLTATLLSPITLPFILRAKFRAMRSSYQSQASEACKASKASKVQIEEPLSPEPPPHSGSKPVLTGISTTPKASDA